MNFATFLLNVVQRRWMRTDTDLNFQVEYSALIRTYSVLRSVV